MSKNVDLQPLKYMAEKLGVDFNERFVLDLCEGDIFFGEGYVFDNKCPPYQLKREDPNEYEKQFIAYQKESHTLYMDYIEKQRALCDYTHLVQKGGGEGGSEYCYGVFKLGDKYYRAEYSYYSYNGYETYGIIDSLKEVTPKEKKITVYE